MRATPDDLATAPHLHAVQLPHHDVALVRHVADFLGSFLDAGACAIVVATRAHRERIATHLSDSGIDMTQAARQGRYLSLDASETLDRIMEGGRVNEARFAMVIGGLLQRAAMVSPIVRRHVGVFDEMVAVLAESGATEAAIDLERAWNHLAQHHAFSLVCGSCVDTIGSRDGKVAPDRIRPQHPEVINGGAESTRSGAARPRGARGTRSVLRLLHGDAANASAPGEAPPLPAPPPVDVLARHLRTVIAAHALPLELHVDGEWLIATTVRQPGFALHLHGGTVPPRVHLYGDAPIQTAGGSDPWAPLWRLLEAWGLSCHELRDRTPRYPDLIDRML